MGYQWKYTVAGTRNNCPAYRAFLEHRLGAKGRGIPFQLTFAEWQWLWLSSGKWEQRGNCKGQYQMARRGPDIGPYAVGNVDIKTREENLADVDWKAIWTPERREAQRQRYTGKPKSEQTRERMSSASKARGSKPPTRFKPVEVCGIRYGSMGAAANALGIGVPALRQRMKSQPELYKVI
jgi:hypothetical protein